MATHSSTLAWKIPWMEEPGRAAVHGVSKSRTQLSSFIFTFHFPALEKEMATHSSVLAWRIPGRGEPGGLPSMGSHRVGHDWSDLAAAAEIWAFLVAQMLMNLPAMQETQVRSLGWLAPLEKGWQPTPVFFPGEVHGQRSLAGYSSWGGKQSDWNEQWTLSLSDQMCKWS